MSCFSKCKFLSNKCGLLHVLLRDSKPRGEIRAVSHERITRRVALDYHTWPQGIWSSWEDLWLRPKWCSNFWDQKQRFNFDWLRIWAQTCDQGRQQRKSFHKDRVWADQAWLRWSSTWKLFWLGPNYCQHGHTWRDTFLKLHCDLQEFLFRAHQESQILWKMLQQYAVEEVMDTVLNGLW